MDAFERLKASMVRVRDLIDFYQHSPFVILHGIDAAGRDVLDTATNVTVEDLERLLDGLADRDISLKRPEFKTPREIERDAKLTKVIVDEHETWLKGYKAGRDGEMVRVRGLIKRYITGD
jgi:hypothetical protein